MKLKRLRRVKGLWQIYNNQDIPNLKPETKDDKATDTDYAIACDDQFTSNDNFLVGMAQVDSLSGRVVPTFTVSIKLSNKMIAFN